MKGKKLITLLLCVSCIFSLMLALISYTGVKKKLSIYSKAQLEINMDECINSEVDESENVDMLESDNAVSEKTEGYDSAVAGIAVLSGEDSDEE